jgi:hypothetical protein
VRRVAVAAVAWALGVLWSSAVAAQPARAWERARRGRFGALAVTVCPGDPPAEEWRQRAREEFGDPTFTLYAPSAETAAIHAELRVVLRAAQCAEGAEAYELFMTDGRGEAAQTAMLRMGAIPRDARPQVAALRVAEVFRTHREQLLGRDPPMPVAELPRSPSALEADAGQWDLEVGIAARALPSTGLWLLGPQVALGRRPTPASRQRLRFELGASVMTVPNSQASVDVGLYRGWLACGWTIALLRSRQAELAVGARGELALNMGYPTVTLGATVEGQVAVARGLWLWTRADLGGHALGAQLQVQFQFGSYPIPFLLNIAEGFTAAITAGVRFNL